MPLSVAPSFERTARTRHGTAAVHDGSWWKVQCSRSSATLVFVAIRFLGPRNHTW